ncbi:hypothetical protein FD723_41115 (plasmid) [Nostoc sp. C052]|uniref:hypothetical protein n=1 Tax=Nostoc sp. C052 TaxID=2576902 RepID=UPI0015C2E422|nr:hypothetical protein [Nostoc sp. C052]QLE46610.1 hypothetical protein FD723_41115 [Nostoc sp. C052]
MTKQQYFASLASRIWRKNKFIVPFPVSKCDGIPARHRHRSKPVNGDNLLVGKLPVIRKSNQQTISRSETPPARRAEVMMMMPC